MQKNDQILNILFVEDSQDDAELIALHLEKSGLKFSWKRIQTEKDLKKELAENKYDLVISDYIMPGLYGIEVVQIISASYPDLPIIIVSGQIGEDLAVENLKAGASDYLMKNNLIRLKSAILEALEKKETEVELKKSIEILNSFMESATDGFILYDAELNFIDINKSAMEITGLSRKEVIGNNILDIIPDIKETGRYDKYREVINTGVPLFISDLKLHSKPGNKILELKAFKVGEGLGIIFTDITERKQAEEELKKSKAKYADLYENAPDMFVSVDAATGKIIQCNNTLALTLGYTKDGIIGQSIFFIYHPDNHDKAMKAFQLFVTTGVVKDEELYLNRKDGDKIDVSLNVSAVKDKKGKILYSRSVCRDITKRKLTENELKRSREKHRLLCMYMEEMREKERLKMALDLHDDLGQKLTALNIDLNWLKKRLSENKLNLLPKLNTMSDLLNETVDTVQKIATELRPGILDDLGLSAAIDWQLDEFEKNTGIKRSSETVIEEITVSPELAIVVFRIVQESLTNIARHANASHVLLNLIEDNNTLIVKIKDNGRGITDDEIENPDSFGLFSIKERAKTCGGEIFINGIKEKGTEIILKIPLTS